MEIDDLIQRKEKAKIDEASLNKERGLAYYQILQIDNDTHKERLKKMEASQKWTFERTCKKDGIHKDDWEEEFMMYWIGFLKGEYKSINQYLKRLNFKEAWEVQND